MTDPAMPVAKLLALAVAIGANNLAAPKREARQVTTWGGLVALSFGLAIDNVVVGFSLGLGEVDALLTAGVIAVAAVVFSVAGLHLGRASRHTWETAATVGAGVALVAIGAAVALGLL